MSYAPLKTPRGARTPRCCIDTRVDVRPTPRRVSAQQTESLRHPGGFNHLWWASGPLRSRLCCCVVAVVLLAGCGRQAASPAVVVSDVNVADPALQDRVLRGFYDADKAWKWTGRIFAVLLDAPPPPDAPTFLVMDFGTPEELMNVVKEVTVTARVNGEVVGSQKYTAIGRYQLQLKVPARLLKKSPAEVEFELDHAARVDGIAHEIGLNVVEIRLSHHEKSAKGTDSLTVAVR
jgi:hypothetical protein